MESLGRNRLRLFVLVVVYLIAAHCIAQLFLLYPGINRFSRAKFPAMVAGTATRPYVYRALAPSLVRTISRMTPEHIKTGVRTSFEQDPYRMRDLQHYYWESEHIFDYLVYSSLVYVVFFMFCWVMRALIMRMYPMYPFWVADLAPFIFSFFIPLFFAKINFIYDPFSILLSALLLWLIVTERALLFAGVFALEALNKETAVIFVVAYWLYARDKTPRGRLYATCGALIALWLGVKFGLYSLYRGNAGEVAENHIADNLWMFTSFSPLVRLLKLYGRLVPLAVLVVYHWRSKPRILRHWCLMVLVSLGPLALVYGALDEPRVFYELLPIAFLLGLPSLAEIFGFETTTRNGMDGVAHEIGSPPQVVPGVAGRVGSRAAESRVPSVPGAL